MARLQADSRFSLAPSLGNVPRSRFVRDQKTVTSFNVGDCIPFYCDEVLPGDNFSVDTSKVVRLQTLLTPIFDDIYLDTYYFYVPSRLTWTHWKEFMGENNESAWIPQTEYSVPQVTAPSGGWSVGTIADYFGIPTGVSNLSVSALPFRAYALIMNYFFRDENLTDPLNISLGDSNIAGSNGSSYVNDVVKGGKPFKAAKFHDYFTSCLPSPQKGPSVNITLAGLSQSTAPVYGNGYPLQLSVGSNTTRAVLAGTTGSNWQLYPDDGSGMPNLATITGTPDGTSVLPSTGIGKYVGVAIKTQSTGAGKAGLVADLGAISSESIISLTELRSAFAIQQFYEAMARGGSRYSEILRSQFKVTSPDARLQNPEYLGGNRIALNISQSVQNSETGDTPQGNVAGYSVTADSHSDFTHSFVEHGYVIGIMVARYKHTYQQGIERFWSRKNKFQFYWPLLNGLSEQPVYNKELYAQGTSADDEVFGYQENYADYRYKPNKVTGEMRSSYAQSLDVWHLGDDYNALPALSDSWIREDETTVDRVIAVSSRVSDQLLADIYVRNVSTRSMPVYSIPGLTRM